MTRHLLIFLLATCFLASCNKGRSYKYVEVIEDESLFGGTTIKDKDPKTIYASTDSAAYVQAYKDFCISLLANKEMKASIGKVYSTPLKFKLYNDKGIEITNIVFFADKGKTEKEIKDYIFSLSGTIPEATDKNKENQSAATVDSAKVKDLEKYFRKNEDEFSNNNKIWYKPRSAPEYTNSNGIFCYFQTENGIADNLRFRLQYHADKWLFFSKVQFSIDGKAYEYIPADTETDSGNGGYIWEWFDEPLSEPDKELIEALANAKSAKMKLIGRQYHEIKTIPQEQITNIKRVLELYRALGGRY